MTTPYAVTAVTAQFAAKPLPDPIPLKIQLPSSRRPKIGFWPGQEETGPTLQPNE